MQKKKEFPQVITPQISQIRTDYFFAPKNKGDFHDGKGAAVPITTGMHFQSAIL
jgi:hypothetical protein